LKPSKSRNIAASVRQKLLNIATSTGEDFGLVLTRYAVERVLYRLGQSNYRDQFHSERRNAFSVLDTHTASTDERSRSTGPRRSVDGALSGGLR